MVDGWAEMENAIVECLRRAGSMSLGELARRVGLSEGEATTCLCLLAGCGRVRIQEVALNDEQAIEAADQSRIAGARPRHRTP